MFLFRASRASRTTGIDSSHLFSPRALSQAVCTQTGFPDRNTCTACMNAVQIRTSDTSHRPASPATQFRTARSAIPHAFPEDSPASARARDPIAAGRWCAPAAVCALTPSANPSLATPDRYPDSHAADISPQTLHARGCILLPTRLPKQASMVIVILRRALFAGRRIWASRAMRRAAFIK
jgi:hypothetical protein